MADGQSQLLAPLSPRERGWGGGWCGFMLLLAFLSLLAPGPRLSPLGLL
jgi:hypothetical protein